jgi:rhodanese-related sulfurtransferase
MLVSPSDFVAKTKATIKECSVKEVRNSQNAGTVLIDIRELYCGTGGRSALAAKSLDDMGFQNVKSMDGGIVAWAEAQFPLDVPMA